MGRRGTLREGERSGDRRRPYQVNRRKEDEGMGEERGGEGGGGGRRC